MQKMTKRIFKVTGVLCIAIVLYGCFCVFSWSRARSMLEKRGVQVVGSGGDFGQFIGRAILPESLSPLGGLILRENASLGPEQWATVQDMRCLRDVFFEGCDVDTLPTIAQLPRHTRWLSYQYIENLSPRYFVGVAEWPTNIERIFILSDSLSAEDVATIRAAVPAHIDLRTKIKDDSSSKDSDTSEAAAE